MLKTDAIEPEYELYVSISAYQSSSLSREASKAVISTPIRKAAVIGTNITTNANVPISIELSSFQLSPQISFEAVTFNMPVNTSTLDDWLVADYWRINGSSQTTHFAGCSDLGCIVRTPNDAGTKQD